MKSALIFSTISYSCSLTSVRIPSDERNVNNNRRLGGSNRTCENNIKKEI
jgi:hypothetical protein